ncbi:MltR family transcriptional regulator [Flavobacterium sp. MAHUQ-51]|uniref:MltR family transcriptional regulator n=1 Tax=Flavobacterium sp. GCM10022190 TaxID=3252639 RepID=UPI0036157D07
MTTRQFDELVDEILDERNDRSLIILCSSIIDEQLYNILNKFLKPPLKDDDLLKGDNPLSTFSSRIKIIYRIGIIDNTFRDILDTIRKIRNLSAHSVELNLGKSPIKDHINTLKKTIKIKPSYELTKKRYFENNINSSNEVKALFVTICVILEAIDLSILEIEDNKKTIQISKR